jgi:hypothetical protein
VTVASTQNRKTFAGDDATTSFATTPIVFFATSDLRVYVTTDATGASTLLTEGVGYTVSGGDEASGAVGTVDTSGGSAPHGALLSGTTLVILRELPLTQGADFVNNDASDAEVAEAALDKLVMNAQRLDERITRSFVLPDGDVSGASTELPTPTASTIIGWNSGATALQNYVAGDIAPDISVSTFMETVLDDVDAATARATLDVPSNAETILDAIIDAAGDLIYGTAADTPARLAIGTARQVLQVNTGATAPEWAINPWSTGDVKLTLKTAADSGWVLMDDGTIGNAASGGTTRANADTEDLFTLLWNNTADAQCPVSTGRGGSASADFAADKTITLPLALGRALASYGTGASLTARVLAETLGVETHALTETELPATINASNGVDPATGSGAFSKVSAGRTNGTGTGCAIAISGGGQAHENMQPTLFLNVMIKL